MTKLNRFDSWLEDTGPAALVLREYLVPVEGADGVFFPPTFAASEDRTFKGGYNLDEFPDGRNVCLVDSVGSQANRIEPLFTKKDYAGLVPQVVVKAGDMSINLLAAGHRAGDAIVRCSSLQEELQKAFLALQAGNAEPMAALAPTSLVFGAWDSRDTQAKAPRLLSSTIRAFDVRKLTRSAQYVPAIDYVGAGQLDEPADKNTSDAYAKRGFVHVPASSTHGGVIAKEIRRDATLHLAALRLLAAGDGADKTVALRRYVLGLALTAFTYTPAGFLRQGCNLVPDADKGSELKLVLVDGSREDLKLTHDDARAFAKVAAREFGIDPDRNIDHKRLPDREVQFDKALVAKELTEAADGAKRQGRKKAK